MPRNPSRFITDVTEHELQQLKFYMDHGKTSRIRHRAHAIRLSHQGKTINEIAEFFSIDRDTVGSWLDRWENARLEGLADKPRPGATPILNDGERELLVELWEAHERRPKLVLEEFEKQRNKKISVSTLKRTLSMFSRRVSAKPK